MAQPPDSSSKKPARRVRLVGEEELRRVPLAENGSDEEKGNAQENPYWLVDEAEHPDPSKGCIRRGLCCKSNPGSFAPGEAEGAAALLGLTPDAFVKQYLIIDWVEFEGAPVEVFAPVKVGRDHQPMYETARRVDKLYRFLRGGRAFFLMAKDAKFMTHDHWNASATYAQMHPHKTYRQKHWPECGETESLSKRREEMEMWGIRFAPVGRRIMHRAELE